MNEPLNSNNGAANNGPLPEGNAPLPDNERTVVRPRPGGRPSTSNQPFEQAPNAYVTPSSGGQSNGQSGRFVELPISLPPSDNPILRHAYKLLAIVQQIRSLAQHPNPGALKEQLTAGIRDFENQIRKEGVATEKVIAARYVLCTVLDESAALTPWGSVGVWAKDTLLVRFHNETWGGEKVFVLLSRLAESPGTNLDLLELIYVCLGLGFEGRYRIIDNGRTQLETVRERLYHIIRQQRPEQDRRLSPAWAAAKLPKSSWLDAAPFWAVAGLAMMSVMLSYALLSYLLGSRSDPVFADLSGLKLAAARAATPVVEAPKPKFAGLLQEEVAAGLVSISETAGKSVITLKGDGFFDPGSAELPNRAIAPLEKIANALAPLKGNILVAGHTDSQPIRTLRFPSNWHLSEARAKTVQQLFAQKISPNRLRSEGRAESEPVAANDTAANRARNRRVDVILFTQD
jgi:type VI secretion system protein ImpK